MAETGRRPRAAWSEAVRAAADSLAADMSLKVSDVQERIAEEHGALVPIKTLSRWVADVRARAPMDRKALLSETADRAALLLRSEVARIERQTPHKRDLNRLDQAVKTLKTLDGLEPVKRGSGARTLSDIGRAEEQSPSGGPSQLGAARAAA